MKSCLKCKWMPYKMILVFCRVCIKNNLMFFSPRSETKMKHSLYRKTNKSMCSWCDYPSWHPSKKINVKNKCKQCIKNGTTRSKVKRILNEKES